MASKETSSEQGELNTTNQEINSNTLNSMRLSEADIAAITKEVVSAAMEVYEPLLNKLTEAANQQKQEQRSQGNLLEQDLEQQRIEIQEAMDKRLKLINQKVAERMQEMKYLLS